MRKVGASSSGDDAGGRGTKCASAGACRQRRLAPKTSMLAATIRPSTVSGASQLLGRDFIFAVRTDKLDGVPV